MFKVSKEQEFLDRITEKIIGCAKELSIISKNIKKTLRLGGENLE